MSSRIQVILQDASGNVNTTANVDLYDNAGTTKIGDFINNGDGSYYYDLATSDKYRIKVDGTDQDEYTGRFWSTDDIKTHMDAAAPHSGHTTDAELTAVKGTGWSTETVKGNADDITTIKGTGWTTEDIKTNADAITAMKGSGWVSETIKGNADNIGDMNFAATRVVKSGAKLSEAVQQLDSQVWDNFRSRGQGGDTDGLDRFAMAFDYSNMIYGDTGSHILFAEFYFEYDVVLEWVQLRKVGTPSVGGSTELWIGKSATAGSYTYGSSDRLYSTGLSTPAFVGSQEDDVVNAETYIGLALKTSASEANNIHGSVTLHFRKTSTVK